MKRCILVLLLFCTPLLVIHALPRKKVAIVLSGGGAKGVAHIGALKVIEELGIPIDYVAGTSIGAIVGGLYSIGYTSEQLEIIVKQTNWIDLLTDKISRDAIPFPFKLDDSKYLISLPIKNNEKSGGIISLLPTSSTFSLYLTSNLYTSLLSISPTTGSVGSRLYSSSH